MSFAAGRSCTALIAGLLILISGCSRPAAKPAADSKATEAATASEKQTSEHMLDSALHQLQPENLGIDSDLESAVSMLNSWRLLAEANPAVPPVPQVDDLPKNFLNAELLATLGEKKYTPMDAMYIRMCILARAVAGYVSDRSDDDLRRVVLLFEYVCRNVALNDDPVSAPPLFPYDILLSGRGTASDRAWVFSNLLKQWRIDAVIIRPEDAGGDEDAWLMGVPVGGEVYLFDLMLGLPIPAESTPTEAHPHQPATLKTIVEHPEWLAALSARTDQPYRLDAEQLKSPRIEIMSDLPSWSQRMWELEQVLPGEKLCVLYDALVESTTQPGLIQRLENAGVPRPASGWTLWSHPLITLIRQQQMPQQDLMKMMNDVHMPFMVPFTYEVDKETGQPQLGPAEKQQLRVRTSQLLGQFQEATTGFLAIRMLGLKPFPEPTRQQIHQIAADDAFYWSAVGKYELGEYVEAADALADYSRRIATRQRWQPAARQLLAWSLADQGKYDEAIKALARPIADDPYRPANAVLARRWAALAEAANK